MLDQKAMYFRRSQENLKNKKSEIITKCRYYSADPIPPNYFVPEIWLIN